MEQLWVEYLGDLPVSVEEVGPWSPGQRRLVDTALALRLLTRSDFRTAETPVFDLPAGDVLDTTPPATTPPAARAGTRRTSGS